MKTFFKSSVACIFFCVIFFKGNCQSYAAGPVYYSGHISGFEPGKDSLAVGVNFGKEYIFHNMGYTNWFVPLSKNGDFYLSVPAIDKPARLFLYVLIYHKSGNTDYHPLIYNWITEPGDSITITVNIENFEPVFSGRGSAKYACELKLQQQTDKITSTFNKRISENLYTVENYKKLLDSSGSYILAKKKILDTYKSRISPLVYKILNADIEGGSEENMRVQLQARDYYRRAGPGDQVHQNLAMNEFLHYNKPADTVNAGIKALSPQFLDYMLAKSRNELFFASGGKGYSLTDMYNKIISQYSGLLMEKLLTLYLLSYVEITEDINKYSAEEYGNLLHSAISLVRTGYLKEALLETSDRYKSGSDFFNFALTDTSGKVIRMSDLKGKVVLVDIWFIGCTGCAYFHENFEKNIFPFFKNNPAFEVVSICTDKSREKWLKSIYSGTYTKPSDINLYTQGLGMEHPLIKFYDAQAYPFIMLVDRNGKVFMRPSLMMPANDLAGLIKEAIESHL